MKLRSLLTEALAAARSSLVPSLLIAVVAALMTSTSLITVGRQARLEADLAEHLQSPAARTTVITALTDEARLTVPALNLSSDIDGVATAVGISFPVDVYNPVLGPDSGKVALVELYGDAPDAVRLTEGRWPLPGANEALVSASSQEVLRLEHPAGGVVSPDGSQWAIVGRFEPQTPFGALATQVVSLPASAPDSEVLLRQIHLIPAESSRASALYQASLELTPGPPGSMDVSPPAVATQSTQQITSQVAGYGRQLVLLIAAVGAALTAVVVFADVLVRRRDLGRRRTLGIPRGHLILLVALRAVFPAFFGAAVGAGAGVLVAGAPLDFAASVLVLSVISTFLAALPPAAFAAFRDPVLVMRTA